jgi:hypothetical protein
MDCATEWTMNEHAVGSAANLVFISAFVNSNQFNDQATPVTTATVNLATPNGSNDWHTSDVTVSLAANDDLSGVAKTEYSLDGGTAWQTYTTPVTISQDGQYTVSYRSTDDALNVETAKTISFKLDTNAPAITVNRVANDSYNDSSDITPVFQTTASIQSLKDMVTSFKNAGWIDNAGIANSLQSKLASNALAAFVKEVKAQTVKHISAEAADYLIRDAESLMS